VSSAWLSTIDGVVGLKVSVGRSTTTLHGLLNLGASELSSIPHISWSEPTVQGSVNPSFHTGTRSSYGGQATRMPAKSSGELGDWALERSRPIMAIACIASPLLFIHSIQPNSALQNSTSSP
jgi:hypothetical protein